VKIKMPNKENYTNEFLIGELLRLSKEIGKHPTYKELNTSKDYPSGSIYIKRFGSWNNALEIAELPVKHRPERKNHDHEAIKNDYLSGLTLKEILEKHNIKDHHIIYKALDKFGIERKLNEWTQVKLELLQENYPSEDWEVLLELLSPFNRESIHVKASELNIKRVMDNEWTEEQISLLKDNYEFGLVNKLLELLPNHSYKAITSKAKRLGLKTREYWSDGEIDKLKEVYRITTNYQVIEFFPNRNIDTITVMANKLGLNKDTEVVQFKRKEKIKQLLLDKLKQYAKELGRTPTTHEITRNVDMGGFVSYHRYFGTYTNACLEAGLDPNCGIYGDYTSVQYSKNNDLCYSNAELVITDFFIDNNISFEKEILYSEIIDDQRCGLKRMDWLFSGNIVVEYFGFPKKEIYAKKMNEKIDLCKEYNIKMISLFAQDISDKNMNGLRNKLDFVTYDSQFPTYGL
jgi:hypothetical protein